MIETHIADIPCLVKVIDYTPASPGSFFEPPSGPEIEYEIYDRSGRQANWLLAKVTAKDDHTILAEHEAHLREIRDEVRIDAYLSTLEARAGA